MTTTTTAARRLDTTTIRILVGGLDLADADDRAILRGRIGQLLRAATVECLNDYAAGHGYAGRLKTRHAAVRAIAAQIIAGA